ncbi:MAG TPA: hypothetical protein VFU94_12295 [Conexibacter sp.]|nr:hypothetical protein [Conexibacter sp.]
MRRSMLLGMLLLTTWLTPGNAAADGGGVDVFFTTGPSTSAARHGAALAERAMHDVERAHSRCRTTLAHGRIGPAKPSAGLLAALGILRRPATAQDEAPPALLRGLSAGQLLDPSQVRLARAADGSAYYVIPSWSLGLTSGPPACAHLMRRRLERLLARARPAVRRAARQTMRAITELEYPRHPPAPTPSIALVEATRNGRLGSGVGGSIGDLAKTGWFELAPSDRRTSHVVGLVPDGVATITVHYGRYGSLNLFHRPRYRTSLTITAPVQDNVVSYRVARPPDDALPLSMTWRAADGSIVRVVGIKERSISG